MTPQEQQEMMAALLRSGQAVPPPPVNPYGGGSYGGSSPYNFAPAPAPSAPDRYQTAAQDFAGQDADIAAQRAQAAALAKSSMDSPDLIQAGRVSHAGASPFSALAQGLQGYMGGKATAEARAGSSALAKSRAEQAAAVGDLAREKTERDIAEEARKAKLEADRFTMDSENTTADNDREERKLAQTIAAAQATQGKRDVAVFHNPKYDPEDENSSPTVSYRIRPDGLAEDQNGAVIDATSLTPWKAGTEGSTGNMTKAQIKAMEDAARDPVAGDFTTSPANMISILDNKYFPTGTGQTVDRVKGQYFPSLTEEGPAIEDFQRQVETQLVDNLVTDLKSAKLTPVSDKDLATLRGKLAGVENTPYAILGFMTQELRPKLARGFDEAIKKGVRTEEDRQNYMNQVDAAYIRAAQKIDYPLERLITQGVNPEIIKLAQLRAQK